MREQLKNAQPLRKYTAEDYLQRLADVVSYLEVNNINSLDDLRDQAIDVSDEMSKINDDLQRIDEQIKMLQNLSSMVEIYQSKLPIRNGYQKAVMKSAYYKKHENDLQMVDLLEQKIRAMGVEPGSVKLQSIERSCDSLSAQRDKLHEDYVQDKQRLKTIDRNDDFVRKVLAQTEEKEHEEKKEKEQSQTERR